MRPILTAEIIAVGSELLTPTRIDTNSLAITARLAEHGISVRAKAVVGDSRDDLGAVFSSALARADLVVLTGGLGPTDDDITRDVVADTLKRPCGKTPRSSSGCVRDSRGAGCRCRRSTGVRPWCPPGRR